MCRATSFGERKSGSASRSINLEMATARALAAFGSRADRKKICALK